MDESKRVVQVQAFLHEHIQDVINLETAVNGATNDQFQQGTYAWAADTPRHLLRRTNAYARYRKRGRRSKRKTQQGYGGKEERSGDSEALSITDSWSVKRMKMSTDFWGSAKVRRKVALYPYSKGQRFMLKRGVECCTVHDMSYEAVIQVVAETHEVLTSVLRDVLSSTEYAFATSGLSVSSCRVINVRMVYDYKSYPYGSLGPARLIWAKDGKSFVLLTHELIKETLLKCLKAVETSLSGEESSLSVRDLSSQLAVFRLSGKKSAETLRKCLGNVLEEGQTGRQMQVLQVCNALPPNVTFGMDLKVTELRHPEKLYSAADAKVSFGKLTQLLQDWTPGSFDGLVANKEDSASSTVQVIIIKRDECAGWDIILPTRRERLAACLFQKLVFCGASPSGIENEHLFATHQGQQFFPIDYPDTVAGREYWAQKARIELGRLKRMPLSKIGKSHKELNEDGVVPRWEQLFANSKENTVLVNYDGQSLQQKAETVQLFPVVLELCHHQPKGVKARIEPNAQVYGCNPKYYEAWKKSPRTWTGVSCDQLQLAGFITSTSGSNRIVGSDVVKGVGCIRADSVSKAQQTRLLKGQDTFVLLRNPSCLRSTPCLAAFLRVLGKTAYS